MQVDHSSIGKYALSLVSSRFGDIDERYTPEYRKRNGVKVSKLVYANFGGMKCFVIHVLNDYPSYWYCHHQALSGFKYEA